MSLLTERYAEQINGVLCCYDRVILQGTLPGLCYAEGMTQYLSTHHIRIFDYARFAEPLRNKLRENAERVGVEAGVPIEFGASSRHPQGSVDSGETQDARRSSRSGGGVVGHGIVSFLQAVA